MATIASLVDEELFSLARVRRGDPERREESPTA
jgi:hypothetical protein